MWAVRFSCSAPPRSVPSIQPRMWRYFTSRGVLTRLLKYLLRNHFVTERLEVSLSTSTITLSNLEVSSKVHCTTHGMCGSLTQSLTARRGRTPRRSTRMRWRHG